MRGEQIAAIGRVRAAGGTVENHFDYEHLEELPDQDWIRRVVGRDFFDIVVAVENPPDGEMKSLPWLTGVTWLALNGQHATDTRLTYLAGLFRLRRMEIDDSSISERGLKCLENLTELRGLYIKHTQITEPGFEHLKTIPHLTWLSLDSTGLTDNSTKRLQPALSNVEHSTSRITQLPTWPWNPSH